MAEVIYKNITWNGKKLKNNIVKFFTDKYATKLSGKIISQLPDYAGSNRFLRVNGHDGEIRHFQLREIHQGARCILAESGPYLEWIKHLWLCEKSESND